VNKETHIDEDDVKYLYLGENKYAVFMDKEERPYWREMPDNTIEFASSIRSTADIERITELEEALQRLVTATSEMYFNSKELGWAEDAANKTLTKQAKVLTDKDKENQHVN
jgi:two-component SAPR family response regulator